MELDTGECLVLRLTSQIDSGGWEWRKTYAGISEPVIYANSEIQPRCTYHQPLHKFHCFSGRSTWTRCSCGSQEDVIRSLNGRCALTTYPEFRCTSNETGTVIADWIFKDILCRWGGLEEIVTDNGAPFVKAFEILREKYEITHIRISSGNSQANGLIESRHGPVREALFKACGGYQSRWALDGNPWHVFWAERVSPIRGLGCSLYFAVHGIHPILPLDIVEATYLVPPPEGLMNSEDWLPFRARQLAKRTEDVNRMRSKIYETRRAAIKRFEEKYKNRIVNLDFKLGDLVLVRNTRVYYSLDKKMKPRYLGPVVVLAKNRGNAYIVAELNGTVYRRPMATFRLYPYYVRRRIEVPKLLLDV